MCKSGNLVDKALDSNNKNKNTSVGLNVWLWHFWALDAGL